MFYTFRNMYEYLNQVLTRLASSEGLASYQYLTKDIHVWPDFHGNRSPLSDQNLKGMVNVKKCRLTNMIVICLLLDFWSDNVSTRRKFSNHLFGICASVSGNIQLQITYNF